MVCLPVDKYHIPAKVTAVCLCLVCDPSKAQSCGSPKLCERIANLFKLNISQCKLAENLVLSLSTFRDKQSLNICDLQTLRQPCTRNYHPTMMNIATFPLQYFGKQFKNCHLTQSSTAFRNANLNSITQRHISILCCQVLWSQTHVRWKTIKQWQPRTAQQPLNPSSMGKYCISRTATIKIQCLKE